MKGLSQTARLKRKNRNLVTMKFNMLNCLLETVSTIFLIFLNNDLAVIIYILVLSFGTPLVYILGIEDSKKMSKKASLPTLQVKAVAKSPGEKIFKVMEQQQQQKNQNQVELVDIESSSQSNNGSVSNVVPLFIKVR